MQGLSSRPYFDDPQPMKIVYIASGAGAAYCGTCQHSNALVVAMRQLGHDALLLPAYVPLSTDEESAPSVDRVVFGGVNVFLQQWFPLLGRLPRVVAGLLDRPALLAWLGRRAASTRPEKLGPMTVSMLRGEEGRQRHELDRLVDMLHRDLRPDVVHLSNALLAGMARQIRRRLNVPVVCTLSGEDTFLEAIPEPYRQEAKRLLGQRCNEIDALVAMNGPYADFAAQYAGIDRRRIHVIAPGVNVAGHGTRPSRAQQRADRPQGGLQTPEIAVGYLGHIRHAKGLHLAAEALVRLCAPDRPAAVRANLIAAGYVGKRERPYLDQIIASLRKHGLHPRLEHRGQLNRDEKIAFLQSLDMLVIPTLYPESKGLVALEAWANGVPVVAPRSGAFVELVGETKGGLLFEPGNADDLARCIGRLAADPQLAARCGTAGQEAVARKYRAEHAAEKTIALYQHLLRHTAH